MKKATLLMAAMLVVALVAATAFVTDSALAYDGSEKKKTQAVSGVNDCGNGDNPIDVFCQNVPSEIQGDGNSPILHGSQD